MKNWKIYSIIITVILILLIIGICVYAFVFRQTVTEDEAKGIALKYANVEENNSTNNNVTTSDEYIGNEKAKEIVLQHAGLNNNDVTFNKVELDVDYNLATYEIEFYYNYFEYDYEINAVTGEILKYEKGK